LPLCVNRSEMEGCSAPPGRRRSRIAAIGNNGLKIVLAPDSFKGSATAAQVCEALQTGLRRVFVDAEILCVPMADGGEGTVQSLVDATGGRFCPADVSGPLGDPVQARYGVLGDGETAVIEMAAASGLTLVPEERRDPRLTSTRGTGELVLAAVNGGCRKLVIGIGGSATNDGGAGMAQALGVSLTDDDGNELPPGGLALQRLAHIDVSGFDARLTDFDVLVACDVDNPLCGPNGASAVYGPQKGATPEMARQLDGALANYADVLRRGIGKDVTGLPGAGAAGGLGAGLVVFLDADLRPGVDIVMEAVGLQESLRGAHLVITGEGAIDAQTAHGKTISGVAKAAKLQGIPVIAVTGMIGDGAESVYGVGVDAVWSIVDRPMSLAFAVHNHRVLLAQAGERIARMLMIHL